MTTSDNTPQPVDPVNITTKAEAKDVKPTDEIVAKIKALLRKTTDRGASEAESKAAVEAAQRLMTKYNIDRIMVNDDEQERKLEIGEVWFSTGRQRYETDMYIARILRRCFSIQVLFSSEWERVEGFRKRWDGERISQLRLKQRLVYFLVGDKVDIEVAKTIITELHPIMRHLLNKHLRATGQTWSSVVCHSYFDGLTDAYIAANKAGAEEAMLEAGAATAGKYALVVQDKDKAGREYIKQNIKTVRSRVGSGPRDGGYDHGAFEAGQERGKNIKLGTTKLRN